MDGNQVEILIIDDDPQIGETIGLMVERLGHCYDLAFSGSEGLEKSRTSGYDLIFLDIELPDGSGLDIIKELRDSETHPEIIVLTGFGSADGAGVAIEFVG